MIVAWIESAASLYLFPLSAFCSGCDSEAGVLGLLRAPRQPSVQVLFRGAGPERWLWQMSATPRELRAAWSLSSQEPNPSSEAPPASAPSHLLPCPVSVTLGTWTAKQFQIHVTKEWVKTLNGESGRVCNACTATHGPSPKGKALDLLIWGSFF